jgi:superfamily I DNA/RNA helicase
MERGIPPDRIGFFTFTRRGVEEAISRASMRFNLPRSAFRYFNTLHSAAFRHLGLTTDQVMVGNKIREFGSTYGHDIHGGQSFDDGIYTSFYGDDLVLFLENLSRITLTPVEIVFHQYDYMFPNVQHAWQVIKDYREYKEKNKLLDFTDMLEHFIKQEDPPRLEVVMVDEAQDLSELQWCMVEHLCRSAKRIYIAGDDDQTIFTWAGASEKFISMPGAAQVLKQSYRVPGKVHDLANKIIRKVINRREKVWLPRDAEGSYSIVNGIAELSPRDLNAQESVMLLGRTVKMLRKKFVPYCRHFGLLYRYFDANSIKPSIAKAITAWRELQDGRSIPSPQIVSIYNLLPSEGHGKKPGVAYGYKTRLNSISDQKDPPHFNLQQLKDNYGLLAEGPWEELFVQITPEEITYFKKVLANGFHLGDKPKIHISTIHRVKGGQANTVVLLSDTAKPSEQFASNIEEETRVFYTGITRTYQDLIVIAPEKKYHFGGLFE